MSGVDPDHAHGSADDFATYVAAMTGEMARLARAHGYRTLAYLLEIVRLEARSVIRTTPSARRAKPPAGQTPAPPAGGAVPRPPKFSAVARERR